jgi:hypothetical protein
MRMIEDSHPREWESESENVFPCLKQAAAITVAA